MSSFIAIYISAVVQEMWTHSGHEALESDVCMTLEFDLDHEFS